MAGFGPGDQAGVLVGRGLAKALDVHRGDTIRFLVSIPGGGINGVEARVRGIFTTEVKAYDDSAARMSIALARELLRVKGAHAWVVGLASTERTDETVAYLRERLPADRFEVKSWFELSDFYRKSVTLLSRQVDVVTLLIGVIIVLGISNTMTMSVLDTHWGNWNVLALGTRPLKGVAAIHPAGIPARRDRRHHRIGRRIPIGANHFPYRDYLDATAARTRHRLLRADILTARLAFWAL